MPLLDEICGSCGAELIDMGDEMRCVVCYPPSYEQEKAKMHSVIEPWLKRQIEARETEGLNLNDLARDAAQHFVHDRTFINETVAALVRAAAREEAQRILRYKRGSTVLLGDQVTTRADLERRAQASSLWSWMEQVGERRIRLPDMTREDLLAAGKERQERGRRELQIAAFWNTLAQKMKPGQKVADRFSAEEIASITKKREALDQPVSPLALRDGTA